MPGIHDRTQSLAVLSAHGIQGGLDALDLFDNVLGAFALDFGKVRAEGGEFGRLDIAQGADLRQILAQNLNCLLACCPTVVVTRMGEAAAHTGIGDYQSNPLRQRSRLPFQTASIEAKGVTINPAGAGELVHQPTRDANIGIFGALADQRQLEAIHMPTADGLPERGKAHLYGCRGTQPGADGDIRGVDSLDAPGV